MASENRAKVIYYGRTLVDLTGDDVTPEKLAVGTHAHGKDGQPIVGTNTNDVDSSDATMTSSDLAEGATGYARGGLVEGSIPKKGKVDGSISTKTGTFRIPYGIHDGSGEVSINPTSVAQLIPQNLRAGTSVLGIDGEMTGSEDENPETGKVVVPSNEAQTITPASGFTCFRELVVSAVPYSETPNSAGGITVTIG